MTPSKPATPSEGKPDDAKIEQEAAESKAAPIADEVVAQDETAAEAAKPNPRRTRAKAKAADEPEATADAEKPRRARRKPASAKAKADDGAEAADDEPATDKPKPRRARRKAEPEKPAKPAARKKRAAHDWGDNPPMVRAHAKYVRTSARKARLVCDHIRGKSVEEARAILAHASRDVARDWSKLLESAVANAEHNHELIGDELRIAAVKADEGPTLKRFRPRAMGRATKIRKRTSHLSITLTPKDGDR
jgi:ribosomal protein L22